MAIKKTISDEDFDILTEDQEVVETLTDIKAAIKDVNNAAMLAEIEKKLDELIKLASRKVIWEFTVQREINSYYIKKVIAEPKIIN